MFRKIYTFGCSFSAPYWLEEEKTYTSLLAKNYNCEELNNSKPADCNDAIFLKFTDHLPDFKENDLIIYNLLPTIEKDSILIIIKSIFLLQVCLLTQNIIENY